MDALKAGNIKPLTAAEVREVIDTYAAQINQHRASAANGAKALRTSAEIYRGVDKREMENRAAARDAVNAQSVAKLQTTADRAVNNLLDILHFGENGESITSFDKKLAKEILAKLSNPTAFDRKSKTVDMVAVPVKFTLQKNGKILAKITLGNRNTFSIDTGLDRNGLVEKAVALLNADAASTPPKVGKPRVEEEVAADDIMQAINELESGGIGTEEFETGKVKAGSDNVGMSKENLLRGLKRVFDALKEVKGQDQRKVLRDANMEDVVRALQQALDKVRHLDNRNTILINNVREAFYGNPAINTDDLFKEISDILNKKRVNPMEKVDENIKNKVVDLEETININAFLGADAT